MGCGGSKDKDFDDIKITRDAADDARPANLLLEAARADRKDLGRTYPRKEGQ